MKKVFLLLGLAITLQLPAQAGVIVVPELTTNSTVTTVSTVSNSPVVPVTYTTNFVSTPYYTTTYYPSYRLGASIYIGSPYRWSYWHHNRPRHYYHHHRHHGHHSGHRRHYR